MTNPSEWQDRALAAVQDVEEARLRVRSKVNLTPEQQSLVQDAAAMRGMSVQAFMTRSIMAMTAYDLGLGWDDVMADEGPIRKHGQAATYDRTPKRGTGFGRWRIVGLR